jgi:hypothetical protein
MSILDPSFLGSFHVLQGVKSLGVRNVVGSLRVSNFVYSACSTNMCGVCVEFVDFFIVLALDSHSAG